jgi:hypothetical protein
MDRQSIQKNPTLYRVGFFYLIPNYLLTYAEVEGQYEQLGYECADGGQDGVD